jgi:hypothetical protein
MSPTSIESTPRDAAEQDQSSGAYRVLVESVKSSRCILFLGAGVHYPPPEGSRFTYPPENRPPLGSALAQELAGDCNFAQICTHDEPTNLQRVSLCYEQEVSRGELVNQIRNAVEEKSKPSAAVRALAELPFSLVITTNYDTLFERALRVVERDPFVTEFDPQGEVPTRDYPQGRDPSPDKPFVFKMHGDVNVPESIVVTDEDYISFVLRMNAADRFHPVPETFRYQFARWPTLFVGYSLLDYNLRLLFRTLRWKVDAAQHPDSYSVDIRPDPLIRDRWHRDQGFRFIAEDVWEFVPRLYQDVLGREMPA